MQQTTQDVISNKSLLVHVLKFKAFGVENRYAWLDVTLSQENFKRSFRAFQEATKSLAFARFCILADKNGNFLGLAAS